MSRRLLSGCAALCCALPLAACDAGDKSAAENAALGPAVRIVSPRMDQVLDGPDVTVMFDVRDYDVSMAKSAEGTKSAEGAANPYVSGSGQHIHLILDNEPYQAIYDDNGSWDKGEPYEDANKNGKYDPGEKFTDVGVQQGVPLDPKKLTPGTHWLRAFPSAGPNDAKGAAWHESRKNPGAFAWIRFHVKVRGEQKRQDFDATKNPTLTYSRPKGEYAQGKPESPLLFPLLLDFYVTGCALSKDGYRVQASVDGKALDPIFEWGPSAPRRHLPSDLASGDHMVALDLLDKDGKPVDGPFNHTERKITVK